MRQFKILKNTETVIGFDTALQEFGMSVPITEITSEVVKTSEMFANDDKRQYPVHMAMIDEVAALPNAANRGPALMGLGESRVYYTFKMEEL